MFPVLRSSSKMQLAEKQQLQRECKNLCDSLGQYCVRLPTPLHFFYSITSCLCSFLSACYPIIGCLSDVELSWLLLKKFICSHIHTGDSLNTVRTCHCTKFNAPRLMSDSINIYVALVCILN